MSRVPRKSDGRRIFSAEFKRQQIGHLLRGELTVAELSRKLGIAPSLLQRWKRFHAQVTTNSHTPRRPANNLQTDEYIRQLQLLVGKQTVELELLRAEVDALKKGPRSMRAPRL
jgi:transposase-like protein